MKNIEKHENDGRNGFRGSLFSDKPESGKPGNDPSTDVLMGQAVGRSQDNIVKSSTHGCFSPGKSTNGDFQASQH